MLKSITLVLMLHAIQHLAENNSTNSGKFPGHLQLHQHTINLVWLGRHVLNKRDGPIRPYFVRSSKRCNKNGKAAAIKIALRCTSDQRSDARIGADRPRRYSADRGLPGLQVHAIRKREILRHHRRMKSHKPT